MTNLIYAIVLVAIFAFTDLQIQGSAIYMQEEVPVYEDSCIINHFGETDSLNDLEKIVFEAPFDKVVDAFIDCPRQMCEIYYGKIKSELSDELDDLIKFLRDSKKISQFYSALHSLPKTDYENKSELTCLQLYLVSFLYDIPHEYYLNELKKSDSNYLEALVQKAVLVKTKESKNEITDMLNGLISKVYRSQNSDLARIYEPISYFVRLTTKLMNFENVFIKEVESNTRWAIVLLALRFNRYDLAERAAQNSSSIDLDEAKDFLDERAFKSLEDKKRAIEILMKLLPNEADRRAFNEFLNLRTDINISYKS